MVDKRGIAKIGIISILLAAAILISFYVFAETAEEEKARLEAELTELEQTLAVISAGFGVNYSGLMCGVSQIMYNNYNCDNLTGYHTVNKIKLRIEEIKSQLKGMKDLE